MRYSTLLSLLPLASATNVAARDKDTDVKYEVSNFAAYCTSVEHVCSYDLTMVTSNNPDFKQSCSVTGKSKDGQLPTVDQMQCGTYVVSVDKLDNGALVMTVYSNKKEFSGDYTIPKEDLKTSTSGDRKVQSYIGKTSFTIDAKRNSSPEPSTSEPPSTSAPTSASTSAQTSAESSAETSTETSDSTSSTSSASPTTSSETSSTTSAAPNSSDPPRDSGATRGSAFTGALVAFAFMGLAF